MTRALLLVHTGMALACLGFAAGCKGEAPPPPPQPRPISVVRLEPLDPVGPLQLTGAVKAWKEQLVSFEVSGPVTFIVDTTTYVEGRWEEDGNVVAEGDILARVDEREYRIMRDIAKAAVEVAEQNVSLAQVELDKVLPANVAASKANRDRGDAEFLRIERARQKDAVSELDLIRAQADRDQGVARLEQSEADLEAKKAEIISLQATVKQAREQLAQAQYDLDRCVLRAPASGEVSDVFVEAGGYAAEGSPVAHLVMMDPMKVDLSLSAESAAPLKQGDAVRVFPPGTPDSVEAFIYQKSTIADPRTRTFRVSIMCRNEWRYGGFEPGNPLLDLPRAESVNRLIPMRPGDPDSPMAVEAKAGLFQDESGGWYVWASDEVPFGQTLDRKNPVLTLRKVKVVPGEERRDFQGLLVLQDLKDAGTLTQDSLIARGLPADLQDGAQVLIAQREWMLHPGQILPVLMAEREPEPGVYLPMNLIKPFDESSGYIFVEQSGKAVKVKVRFIEKAGELVRIEAGDSSQQGLLAHGAKVIADHVHFLQDGELVRVVETRELSK